MMREDLTARPAEVRCAIIDSDNVDDVDAFKTVEIKTLSGYIQSQ